METGRFSEIFLARLRTSTHRVRDVNKLGRFLKNIFDTGCAAWPTLSVSAEEFVSYLAERMPPHERVVEQALRRLPVADLYLACACVRGDESALAAFDQYCLTGVDKVLARVAPGLSADDVRQVVRQKLFVGAGKSSPKIGEYSGLGDLRSWVRMVVVRAAISLRRKGQREVPCEDLALANAAFDQNPELNLIKRMYRTEFNRAFEEAVEALSPRERNLLRQHLVDHLNIDQIGMLYRVHRVTAARWLTKARRSLIAALRKLLMKRLRVDQSELKSIMKLIQSQVDVSIRRVFKKTDDSSK